MHCHNTGLLDSGITNSMERHTMGFINTKRDWAEYEYVERLNCVLKKSAADWAFV
jgi:hypothetical protein